MTTTLDLPADGVVTRPAFDALPSPNHGWAWELHDGRLELVYMPVTHWHWKIMWIVLNHWMRLGREVSGEQYVADSGFVRGGTGRHNYVADGVVFVAGHRPAPRETTHDASVIDVVVEAVSDRSEENDAVDKFAAYAKLGIPQYWIVRGDPDADEVDGMITMYELRGGSYEVVGNKLASHLGTNQE